VNNRGTLVIEQASFRYAENPWSLDVPALRFGAQRMTCIVGPNGSGKSTLLRIAAGLLIPATGHVELEGKPLAGLSRRAIAQRVGFLPQESPPLFDYTVNTVVQMGRYAHTDWLGSIDPEGARAIDEAIAAVGLTHLRKRPLSQLSGGERRRALIAAVLAQTPNVLLMDEPTAALDIHHAVAVMRLLAKLGEGGQSVVIVTHELNLAALFAERLIMLVNGRIIADGTPQQVIAPDVLHVAYGNDVFVREHPETGGPLVVARRDIPVAGGSIHA